MSDLLLSGRALWQHTIITKPSPRFRQKSPKRKKKPKLVAVVDEDNCTGCQVCVPFCPVDCIETVPQEKYNIPIPPVQIRFNECIGCQICARVCRQLTWDAIDMLPTAQFEETYKIDLTDGLLPAYGNVKT